MPLHILDKLCSVSSNRARSASKKGREKGFEMRVETPYSKHISPYCGSVMVQLLSVLSEAIIPQVD